MKKRILKLASIILCLSMLCASLIGCGGNDEESAQSSVSSAGESTVAAASTESLTPLEYTIFLGVTNPITTVDNPNDVVTPYVEQKFNVKIKEVIQPQTSVLPKDRLNMMIASDTVPDVMIADGAFASYAVSTGKFMDDLGDTIQKNMPNLNKYFDESKWANFSLNGKVYSVPSSLSQTAKMDEMFKDDPYYPGFDGWAYWVREDILAKAGYTFTPVAELKKNITDQGKALTLDDMKIEPAIDTPEKWVEMLKKIQALNLKVGDKSVIPMSSTSWSQFHMGNMFGLSQFKISDDGKVSGYLGNPEAKDWYKTLWGLYQDKILDRDFLIQKDDQLQSKISSGLVASGMVIPDVTAARENLQKVIGPEAEIRYIPWPKRTEGVGSFDVKNGGINRIVINKDFKEVDRLLQYFDWFLSDEGFDIMSWGPESAGLWEMKDGKKVFKDQQLADAIANGGTKEGTKGPEYYGLFTSYNVAGAMGNSRAAVCAPQLQFSPADQRHSYNTPLDIFKVMKSLACQGGINSNGKAAYDDGGVNSSAVGTYFWGKFQNDRAGKVFAAKTEADFDKAWEEQYNLFVKETNYDAAVTDMQKFFADTLKK